MKLACFLPLLPLILNLSANAANFSNEIDSDYRVSIVCQGEAADAEVFLGGKFKGTCPIEIWAPRERIPLLVRKVIDAKNERVFEMELYKEETSINSIEVLLSEPRKISKERLSLPQHSSLEHTELPIDVLHTIFRDCSDCPEMVVIPHGSYEMGSNLGPADERPVHHVNINQDFAMGRTEVTQAQWKALMGNNPSLFVSCGPDCPVEQVSWDNIHEYIRKLNTKTGKQYRLPSEAEWEYTARAGTTSDYPWGDQASHEFANYGKDECCGGLKKGRDQWLYSAPVGSFPPNSFGLYDMMGNVWEETEDNYHENFNDAPTDGSVWQGGDDESHVLRGGSWSYHSGDGLLTERQAYEHYNNTCTIGFRLARMMP